MNFSSKNHSKVITPLYIKGIKDLIFVSIILIYYTTLLINIRSIKISDYMIILLFLMIFSALISFINNDIKVILSGIRWALPILLIPSLVNRIDRSFLEKIAKVLKLLVIIGFIFQLNQLYTLNQYFGPNQFGFSKRNPGFFTSPNTMSVFLLLSLWFIYNFSKKDLINKIYNYFFMPIFILLAGSAVGTFVMFLFYCTIFYSKIKQKWIAHLIIPITIIFVLIFLPIITNRDTLFDSLFNRLDLYSNLSIINLFIGDRFGLATNTAYLLNLPNILATDSLFLSINLNVGLLFFVTFLTWIFVKSNKSLESFQLFLIASIFSFTSILFEVYPANLLIVVGLAYFMSADNKIFLEK